MPHKAFLKKKSLLDRFKDDHALTGFIQSARAKHTWDNPLTRRKRTKELNGWIKSFAGKNHIRKLSRFNAQQAGRYEALQVAHPDVEFDCLRYADTLELPNGVCVKVYPTIRCPRRCAFVFRVMGFGEVDPALNKNAGKLKYAIHGYYPVYGLERQPSEEFDIYCDDVSELQKWSNCNGWGMGVGPSASSMEAAREVAKGKETMKNEKVIPINFNLCYTFDLDDELAKKFADGAKGNNKISVQQNDGYTDVFFDKLDDLVYFLDEVAVGADSDKVDNSFRYAVLNCKRSRIDPADLQPCADKYGVKTKIEKSMNQNGLPEYEVTLYKDFDDVSATLVDFGF